MARLIDIDIETELIWISFPYDSALVAAVRQLPGRSYHKPSRRWNVPLDHFDVVLRALEPLHFKFTERTRRFWREERGDETARGFGAAGPGSRELPPDTLRVTEVNQAARDALRDRFPQSFWLAGELQNFDKNRARRHAYFELVERLTPESDPCARIQAVMFSSARSRVEEVMEREAPGIELRDGLLVRLRVSIELYSPHGRYQVMVEDVDPVFTSGKLRQNRDQVLRSLEERGILEDNRSLPWPPCPLRVGLITSHDSDACNDFVDELRRSHFPFELTLHDARVQGAATESSVLEALRYFSSHSDRYDVVAIVRGGGSRSDLAYFDTIPIGEAVCRLPVKVVCGVGHHRDQCVLDFIAESAKTPTAAAQFIVGRVEAAAKEVEVASRRMVDFASGRLDAARNRVRRCGYEFRAIAQDSISGARRRLDQTATAVSHGASRSLDRADHDLRDCDRRLVRAPGDVVRRDGRRLEELAHRFSVERVQRMTRRTRGELDRLSERLARAADRRIADGARELDGRETTLRLVDPGRILQRGFAIVHAGGNVVTDAPGLRKQKRASIEFFDGTVDVVVDAEESS